jgi:DNA-binding beta-propeller fold protein YncE
MQGVLDRRQFLGAAAAAVPVWAAASRAVAAASPTALVTADLEAHVAVVALPSLRVVRRIATREGPRSIESAATGRAVVGHADAGVVSLLAGRPLGLWRVLGGFGAPRYTAITRDGRLAYVSDGGHGELTVIDLAAGRLVRRVPVGDGARHLTLAPDGRTLWVALGSSAAEIAIVDLSTPTLPRPVGRVRPPFLAHDVGFSPSGRRVWVTAGRERRIAVFAATGGAPLRGLPADAAPQHVSFGADVAYVASGDDGRVRVHALSDGHVRRTTRVPIGSYNVQRTGARVLLPSLGTGALSVLDGRGALVGQAHVARAAHDACLV